MGSVSRLALLGAAVLAAACSDTLEPADSRPGPISAAITGVQGFAFLPPTLKNNPGSFADAFDKTRKPIVRVVCVEATGSTCPTVVEFTMTSGVKLAGNHYQVQWSTPNTLAVGADLYRLEVREGATLLGSGMLWVVTGQPQANQVPDTHIPVVRGKQLLIKFRVGSPGSSPPPPPPPPPPPSGSVLAGAPGAPAVTAIPWQTVPSGGENYATGNPRLPGLPISLNDAIIHVAAGATVTQVNAVLAEFGGLIIGGVPGVANQTPGLLVVRFPTTTHPEFEALLAELRQRPGIQDALQDVALQGQVHPATNATTPSGWEWASGLLGGNLGLKTMRVPALWNLNDLVRRSGVRTETGVFDVGFFSHDDLIYASNGNPADMDNHGTHVAGTIGATFDNGIGVDGVTPFANLHVRSTSGTAQMTIGLLTLIDQFPALRVINVSLGYNWYRYTPAIDASSDFEAQVQALFDGTSLAHGLTMLAAIGRTLPVIVAAAGNDSNKHGWGSQPARYASPFNNAALVLGVAPIIVVEALNLTTVAPFSNAGGHLSAQGVNVLSTIGTTGYATDDGTSMAAPHITGLISYLHSLEPRLPAPTLSQNPILDLLLQNTRPVTGTPAGLVDAFQAAMDVDRLTGDDRILRGLLDIDDGTIDGNLRVNRNGGVVTTEDADGDFHRGDGVIDMSDFRRFRDWLLQAEAVPGLALDGAATHPKKDLNLDGVVNSNPLIENHSPRADFNGDGILSMSGTAPMKGALGGQDRTDLEVLQSRFNDPYYAASELPGLVMSADVTLGLGTCAAINGVAFFRIDVLAPGAGTLVHRRTIPATGTTQVVTVPSGAAGHELKLVLLGSTMNVIAEYVEDIPPLAPGQDLFRDPVCVTVFVSPNPQSVIAGGSVQFFATVTGTTNAAVTWSATGGTINANGMYTAGQTTGQFVVVATSVEDPSVSAAATVNITSGGGSTPTVFFTLNQVTLNPPLVPIPIEFRARVNNAPGATVQWTHSAFVNGTGFLPGGTVLNVGLTSAGGVQINATQVDWLASVTYTQGLIRPGVNVGWTLVVSACYFQANGQPFINPNSQLPLCQSVIREY